MLRVKFIKFSKSGANLESVKLDGVILDCKNHSVCEECGKVIGVCGVYCGHESNFDESSSKLSLT